MRIHWWNLILCILANNTFAYASITSRFDHAMQKIIHKSNINYLTIFTDHLSSISEQHNSFFKTAINRIPILVTNLTKIINNGDNRSLEMPAFKNPRASTMYIILHNEKWDIKRIYSILDNFTEISPIPTRPKCLLILYNYNADWSENELKNISHYAWTLKFLDFSIIKIDSPDHIISLNYHPFMELYNANYLESEIDIFPDKLKNMNNHSLPIPVYDAEPYLSIKKKSNGEVIVSGEACICLDIFSKMINFKLRYIVEEGNSTMNKITAAIKKLENNTLTMLPIGGLVISTLYGKNITIGNFIESSKLVFIVPNTSNIQMDFSSKNLIYLLSFPFILLILVISVYLLKPKSRLLNNFNIFQIFVGVSTWQPRNSSERIAFFTIAVLSLIYSSDFFSTLTDMKFFRYEQRFDSFEDFLDSKLTVYTDLKANEYDTEQIKQLLSISKKMTKYTDCVNTVITTNEAACISGYRLALNLMKIYKDIHENSLLKISGLSFRDDFVAYSFEKASPYIEKFNWIYQKILEGGLLKKWNFKDFPNITLREDSTPNTNNFFTQFLLIIMFIGCGFGVLTFLFELAMYHCYSHRY